MTTVIIIITLAILAGVYVSWRAGRLDRLHARVETARAALDAALVRRSSVAIELAACGLLDPATSLLLAGAAHDARAAGGPAERAESDLTRALRAALGQPGFRAALTGRGGGEELLTELEAAAQQVYLARKFYNDAVALTRAARRRWLVRALHLAGGAAMPEFFEIDDATVPTGGETAVAELPYRPIARPPEPASVPPAGAGGASPAGAGSSSPAGSPSPPGASGHPPGPPGARSPGPPR